MRSVRLVIIVPCLLALSLAPRATLPAAEKAAKDAPVPAGERRPARADTDLVGRASRELLELQEKVRVLEAQAGERRKAAEARLRDLTAERTASQRAVEALKARLASREKDLAARKEALAAREKEAEKGEGLRIASSEPVREFLNRLEKHIDEGIPWRIAPRKAAVEKAKTAFAAREGDLARALAEAGRLQEDEEALGRLVEAGTIELDLPSGPVALPAFHIGLLAVAFSGPGGQPHGFVKPGQKPEEGVLPEAEGPGAARGFLQALEVLRRKISPRVVDLQVPSLPREATEEGK